MANIFTQVGEDFITDLVDGTITKPANYYIGWGTGAGTAAKADTTLSTEVTDTARATATLSQPTSDTNQFVGTITATTTRAITNAGVFDAATVGKLLLHSDFSVVNLSSGDSIQFTFQLNWA